MSKRIFAKEYEDYLITGKEEALNSLVNGSIEKDYILLIRKLLANEQSNDLQEEIDKFLKRIPENQAYRLKALKIFRELKQNPNKKNTLIQQIKELFNLDNVEIFNKPVKYSKGNTGESKDEEFTEVLPNTFDESKYFIIDKFINDIYSNAIDPNDDEFNKLFNRNQINTILDLNKIPESILVKIFTNENYSNISKEVFFSLPFIKLEDFKKILKIIVDECQKDKDKKSFFEDLINQNKDQLLNEQIDALLEFKDNFNFDKFISDLIYRKFNPTNNKTEKIQALKEIKSLLEKYKYKDNNTAKKVLLNLLKLSAELNNYDFDLFLEYIKSPKFVDKSRYNIDEKLEEQIKNDNKIRKRFDYDLKEIRQGEEDKLIEKYLIHFFLEDKLPYEKFNNYFNEDYLKKLYAKIQFYLGNEEAAKNGLLNDEEVNNLMKEVKLNICDYNKEEFDINEEVELTLEIKNIQTLYVNIYEINTENYYYSNKKRFDNSMSLDGIVPTYNDVYSYNEKPQLLTIKKIALSKLPKKRGLYVIEFIGNGHASRAIIQRGYLKCIDKNTINGKVLYILDEENKICKGDNTGIWINDTWYPSIKETGAILIPFSVIGSTFILKHDNFCCLTNLINIPNESYNFTGLFIINEESFIMGNNTKIIVRPYLYVSNELCPLSYLKNVKLAINSIKIENNQEIPTSNIIENIELSYEKEFTFDYQVPPKLLSVSFEMSAEIQPKTRNEIEKLSFNKEFIFSRENDFDTLIKSNNNGNYIIYLLGKNGEPKKNHPVNVEIWHKKQKEINNNELILLESDGEGKIDLGKLKDVEDISIENRRFFVENINYTYQNKMIILEDQELKLPINNEDKIYFMKIKENTLLENLTEQLTINKTDEKNKLGNILLPKLKEGRYILVINKNKIEINVIKGKEMDIDGFIVTNEGNIRYNQKNETSIAVENVSYDNNELKIKLNKDKNSNNYPRIHISCLQYKPKKIDKNLDLFYQSNHFKNRENNKDTCFYFDKVKAIYLNNKILSDEIQYILDRKQYESTLGNPLEKPSLLLKRQLIRDTTTEIKRGREEMAYRQADMKCGCPMNYCGNRRGREGEREDLSIKMHDYIAVSPLIKTNLIPDDKGEIIIKDINLDEYSFLHVICFDNISCSEDCFYLKEGKTSLRDLRAINELDYNKSYCEFRKLYPLSKNDKYEIKDITSVKYKILDSLEKYSEFIKLVNPSLALQLNDFEFLFNFNNLNLPEKLKKLSEYFCHEMNIYLYFHQNEFFTKYVFPILKYKCEKTFIDYFLLEDKNKLMEYSQVQNIKKLNTFEKCLLIYSLRNDNIKLAKSIARQIRIECPKENQSDLKRFFIIALNLNSNEEPKGEMDYEKMELEEKMYDVKPKVVLRSKRPKKMKEKHKENIEGMFEVDDEIAEKINIQSQLFKEEGKSKEYCETHYYNQVFKNTDNKNLISPNHFFADLAQYWCENVNSTRNIGFKTENILTKPNNFTEAIFMLAVLDLEEKSLPNSTNFIKNQNLGVIIEFNTNAYILTKEINETNLSADPRYALILAQIVSEYGISNKDEEEKEPTKFLTNRTYLQKTIITNISPNKINCEILMQIPEGSLPIDSEEYTIIETANINSYQSLVFEQKFYFPEEGKFRQYPSSASIGDLVVAKSGIKTFEVMTNIKLSKEEISSIDDVLNEGNKKQILEYIKARDVIEKKDLEKIYWMLRDNEFYKQLIEILRNKYIFDESIWQYSLANEDIETLQEYILKIGRKEILNKIGHEIDLIFIKLDKTNNAHILNHLDYSPIINSRVFKLPKAESILTVQFRDTYQDYISFLITLPKLNDIEYMRLCYYLILQQRIKEATEIYNKIKIDNIIGNNLTSLELQYNYLSAYLDFYNGYPKFEKAREICKKYKDISIKSWKNMFKEIEDQLNEYDGKSNYDEIINTKDNEKINKANNEEALSINIKDQDINVIYKNISEINVKYYLVDIEILFSREPFGEKNDVDFNYITPHKTEEYKVEKELKENKLELKVPEEYKNKNFYIEVSSDKIKEYEIYYSSLLKFSIIESIGEIKVMTNDLKPLPKVYIKCFCQTKSGIVKFYKDGFTDLRGKFDYVSLNNDLVNEVDKFAILMISKEHGTNKKICKPPKLIVDTNNEKDNIQKIFDYKQELKKKAKALNN